LAGLFRFGNWHLSTVAAARGHVGEIERRARHFLAANMALITMPLTRTGSVSGDRKTPENSGVQSC